jgi:rhodanese-related sulfurtransferase
MSEARVAGYGGDISSSEAYSVLSVDPSSILIDVRTHAEWTYVGVPDLSPIGKSVVFAEWQTYPEMAVDPAFAPKLLDALRRAGAKPRAPLLFLCRSGARARHAAIAATAAGWAPCFNVLDGFEGPLDASRRRNRASGWRAANLPWAQT